MSNTGWFAVKHGITGHPLFRRRPERLAIWIWLVDNAAWKETEHDVNGVMLTVPRGAVSASLRRIADDTGTSLQVVRGFLRRLQECKMINTAVTHGRTIITLCNYDKYQDVKEVSNTAPNTAATQQQHIKEQINNSSTKGAEKSAPNSGDENSNVTAALWSIGKQYLSGHGVKNPANVIGKWLKQAGSAATVLGAIEAAQKAGTQDPVSYIFKIIGNGQTKTWAQKQDEFAALSPNAQVKRMLGM